MKRLIMLGPAFALAAGCARAPDRIQHGQWEFEIVMTSLEAPGLPPETVQQGQAALNRPQRNRECVTPDETANPLADVRGQLTGNQNMICETSEDQFSGGVIRFIANCRNSNGAPGRLRLTLDGRYEAITLLADVAIDAEIPNPNGSGPMSLRTRGTFKGRRVGSCASR
jgi:hypothetical protein